MSVLALVQMKQVLEVLQPFLDPHDVLSMRTSANNAPTNTDPTISFSFSLFKKEPTGECGVSSARHLSCMNSCESSNKDQFKATSEIMGLFMTASVGNDTKWVQSALCTRMRIVFSRIRLELKTSVSRDKCHCQVYCNRL